MQYREFGKTGQRISALGFGCMRLPEYEKDGKWYVDDDKAGHMLMEAYRGGVNYFDSAFTYCHSNSEAAVGKALKSVRGNVMLTSKCPMDDELQTTGDYRRHLETSLKRMGTDYIDYYHFWALDKERFDQKVMGLNLLKEALKAKEEGLIRHISFSFHDDPKYIKEIIDTTGIMETMLVQYNLLDRSNEQMIAYAASKGLGVVAMGPVGGGRLAAPADLYTKLTGKPAIATYELALRFVLGNKNISCALSGMENVQMLHQNLAIADDELPLSEQEWKDLVIAIEQLEKFRELYCTGCGYCQPCPKGIKIPQLFSMYTHYNVYGLEAHAKEQYNRYVQKGGKLFSDCVNCGMCEKKCPQKLKIRENLQKVETLFKV